MPGQLELSKANKRLSREALLRSRTERPKGWVPPNSMVQVAPNRLGENVKIRWIRLFFNKSEEDKGSYFKRYARGWRPVTPEEIPELDGLRDPSTGHIAQNGCILCKIPAEVTTLDTEYWEDMAIGALEGASSEFLQEDARGAIPKFSKSQKNTFRHKEPGR